MTTPPVFTFIKHHLLVADGKVDEKSMVNTDGDSQRRVYIDPDLVDRLLEMKCSEQRAQFHSVGFPIAGSKPITRATLNWFVARNASGPTLEFTLPLNLRGWSEPWTPMDFIDTLRDVTAKSRRPRVTVDDDRYLRSGIGPITFPLPKRDRKVRELLNEIGRAHV